jgi:CRISPR-associated protein Cas2
MFWIVSYDIVEDRRRRKVMKTLEGFGRRVQYSVFECELNDARLTRLESLLARIVDKGEDSVRFYPLNEADIARIRLLGNATLERAKGHYLV